MLFISIYPEEKKLKSGERTDTNQVSKILEIDSRIRHVCKKRKVIRRRLLERPSWLYPSLPLGRKRVKWAESHTDIVHLIPF